MMVKIYESFKDLGPCPVIPQKEKPNTREEQNEWYSQLLVYGRWLDKHRIFELAERARQLDAIPAGDWSPEQSTLYLLCMVVLAEHVNPDRGIFGMLFP